MTDRSKRGAEDRIAKEAAGWIARLQSSDANDRDRREFQLWVRRDAAHQAAYDEFRELWTDLKDVPIPVSRLKKLRLSRRVTTSNIVAIGIIAALSMSLYRAGIIDRMRADHYTAVGEVSSVTLEDGTRVDLNTDTAIAIRYSSKERRIELLRGEAFFDVVHDSKRPFLVEDGTLQARDIGTQYSMRKASGDFLGDVQVEEGSVEVTGRNERAVLNAGDIASLTAQGQLAVRQADVANETAWRTGKLVFSGQPLREVLETLERYRRGRIVVLDREAAEQRVSGIFDLKDTDQALEVLQTSLPVAVTRLTGMIVVVRSR